MKKLLLPSMIVGLSGILPASATTIDGWNLDNVIPGGDVPSGTTGVSEILLDNDSPESNGRIAYTPPEAISPGLLALNDLYTSGQGTFDGCIRASVTVEECATGFRTGNRFKLQLTDTGAVDLVFDVNTGDAGTQGGEVVNDDGSTSFATPGTNTYQVFGRAINLTEQMLQGFTIELGFGVGESFERSGDDDGLSIAQGLSLGPTDAAVFTQYPFGLFGDADFNNRFELDGFFNDGRSGFDVSFGQDLIESTGLYGSLNIPPDLVEGDNGGSYEDRFGNWLSQEMAPAGLLWDNDGDPTTDALVVAWQLADGTWQALRDIATLPDFDPDTGELIAGTATSILSDPLPFTTRAAAEQYFTDQGALIDYEFNIEDLANLNLNFGIELTDGLGTIDFWASKNNQFTMRLTSIPAPIAPVPLPAGAPLLLAGLAMVGFLRKQRTA